MPSLTFNVNGHSHTVTVDDPAMPLLWVLRDLIGPQGPEALFPSAQVDRMFQILEEFKKRAAA